MASTTVVALQKALGFIQEQRKIIEDLNAINQENEMTYVKVCGMVIKEISQLMATSNPSRNLRSDSISPVTLIEEYEHHGTEVEVENNESSDSEMGEIRTNKTNNKLHEKRFAKQPNSYNLTIVDANNLKDEIVTSPSKCKKLKRRSETMKCDSKDYKCDYCLKSFVNAFTLEKHVQGMHLNKRPFACDECEKSYVDIHKLKRHKETHDRVKCDYCDKKFPSKQKLEEEHVTTHTGELPFECKVCQKKFGFKSSLNRHKSKHNQDRQIVKTVDRQFLCDFCEKSFKKKGHLKRHIMTHTGDRPFKCDVCRKAFARKDDRKRHLFNVHGYQIPEQSL